MFYFYYYDMDIGGLGDLQLQNMLNYDKMKQEYDLYSPSEKIAIQFAGRRVFNLELEAIEKLRKSIKVDELEKKVLKDQQDILQREIWECDSEIYAAYDNLPIDDPERDKIHKKIEAVDVAIWPYESGIPELRVFVTKPYYESLPPQDKIKACLTRLQILSSRLYAIEKLRKSLRSKKVKEYERLYLEKRWITVKEGELSYRDIRQLYCAELPKEFLFLDCRISQINNSISSFESKICDIYRTKLPKDYPFRKELLEDIQEARVYASNYLKLQEEELDARTLDYYPVEFLFGENSRVYNFMAILNGYDTYSPKKKVEVGVAYRNVLTLQLNAIAKWQVSKDMDECEKTISDYVHDLIRYHIYRWDQKILSVYKEVRPDAPYRSELRAKIEAANIKSGIMPAPLNKLNLIYDELAVQNKIKYKIVQRSLYSAECDMILKFFHKLSGYDKLIAHSICAERTMLVVAVDKEIYRLYYEKLPKDYPDRKKYLVK